MCTKKYYSLMKVVNGRFHLSVCYEHQSNYAVLYLLAKSYGVNLCASRSALIAYSGVDIDTVRKLTDKALNKFMRSDKLAIDSELFIDAINLGLHNLDVPNKEDDSGISMDIGLKSRYAA